MRSRLIPVAAVLAIVFVAFVAGSIVGSYGLFGVRVPVSVGDGMVGERVVTLWIGGTAFGARSSVAWRDATGAEHDSGWPPCLSTLGPVAGVRFQGAMVWHDTIGMGTILWVDCSGRRPS